MMALGKVQMKSTEQAFPNTNTNTNTNTFPTPMNRYGLIWFEVV